MKNEATLRRALARTPRSTAAKGLSLVLALGLATAGVLPKLQSLPISFARNAAALIELGTASGPAFHVKEAANRPAFVAPLPRDPTLDA